MTPDDQLRLDERLIARCLALASSARDSGELPFGSVVTMGAEIIAEGQSTVRASGDVTAHA